MRCLLVPVLIFTLCAGNGQAAGTETGAPEEPVWEIAVVPYAWALSDSGSVTVEGRETDVDVTPSEMISKVNGALMLDLDVRKGRFGGFVNTFYASVGDEESIRILLDDITFDTDVKMFLIGAAFYYRLGPYGLGKATGEGTHRAVAVDPYIGGRYTDLDLTLDITTVNRLTGNTTFSSFQDKVDWTDPIVGARTTWDLGKRWDIVAGGDVGGFGVGSEFTWSATVLGSYRFRFSRHVDGNLLFGYRALYQDYREGSGSDLFEYKATLHGPVVGLAIEF
jgi:hypothetical protein